MSPLCIILLFTSLGISISIDVGVQSDSKYPVMWEISTRPWMFELSKKYDRNITNILMIPMAEFQNLKDQGVDIVWMMGVWNLGHYGLEFDRNNLHSIKKYKELLHDFIIDDIIGSPYAIHSYSLNPNLGTNNDLLALKRNLNSIGLKLMLDFVPNHSAIDSPWTARPNLYVRAPKGSSPPYDPEKYQTNGIAYGSDSWGGAWKDTSQLNYWDSELRKIQIESLVHIASTSDYIRCDMAHLVLNEPIGNNWGHQLSSWGYSKPSKDFWEEAIPLVKAKHPNVKFLAEVYDPWPTKLQNQGFDFTYDKKLYDHLVDGHLDYLRGYIIGNSHVFHKRSSHFVENHDEPRAVVEFRSHERANAAALLSFTLPGQRFLFEGQTYGYKNKLDVHLRRAASESKVPRTVDFYRRLLKAISRPVFKDGEWIYQDVVKSPTSWRLIAWKWTSENENVLCVINYSDQHGEGRIILPDAKPVNGSDTIKVYELLSGDIYDRSVNDMRNNGLHAVIAPWSGQIFRYWYK